MDHLDACSWSKADCEFADTHEYCLHPEHACDCAGLSFQKKGELAPGAPHPGAQVAANWWNLLTLKQRAMFEEAFASASLEDGNAAAEVCLDTIRRINNKEQLSDRYLMGLVLCCMAASGEILRDFPDANSSHGGIVRRD